VPSALLALVLAGTPEVTIRVETPRDGRPHRVSVVGLDPATLAALRDPGAAARALAVFTGDPAPGSALPAIVGAYAADEEGLHFLPRFPFVSGVVYTARFRHGRLASDTRFPGPRADGPPPVVDAVYPSADVLPENTLRVYVHFSRPMRERDAARHVRLLDAAGQEVPLAFVEIGPGLWDPGRRRLTLLFHPGRVKRGIAPGEALGPPLVAGREYRLAVDGAMQDGQGTPLGEAFARRFRVGTPDRTSPRVGDVTLEPPAGGHAPLVLRFAEPLDEALLHRLVWVEDEQGAPVPGRTAVDEGETRWTFHPDRPWGARPCTVRIHPALEDRAGNRFDRLFDRDLHGEAQVAEPEPYRLPFTPGSRAPGSTPPAGP
jgi:hypothetical protein